MHTIKKYKKQNGFTIVELLIVIVIIGILAALVIVAYTGIQNRAKDVKSKTDAQAVTKKAEAYAADNNGSYPANKAAFATDDISALDSGLAGNLTDGSTATTAYGSYHGSPCGTSAPYTGYLVHYWANKADVTINAGTCP